MNKLFKGITYSFNRNIGRQDRTIRTIVGITAIIGSVYFFETHLALSIGLAVFAVAQFGTVLSARCILCYFAGKCTIDRQEMKTLQSRGINYETQNS